jgi:hypothetical protein
VKFPWNPGLKLEFEKFSLSEPYTASYRLEGLPKTKHPNRYFTGPTMEPTPDEEAARPKRPDAMRTTGVLSMALRVASGQVLSETRFQMNGLSWQRRPGDVPF